MAALFDDEFDAGESARIAAQDKRIRAWFAENADNPDFITSVTLVARDLQAVNSFRGARIMEDVHDVTLIAGERRCRIAQSRWRQLVDRDFVETVDGPALTKEGERILRLYAQLLRQVGAITPAL